MDSGNSSSMQSSSGGDEEYDSRADQSLSAFLDHPHHHSGPSPAPPPPPQPHNHHQQFHFDTSLLSNYFHNNPLSSSSFSSPSFLPGSDPTPQPDQLRHFSSAATSSLPRSLPPPQPSHQSTQRNPGGGSTIKNNNQIGPVVMKNPKKRSRASRRAPTTVLTTDTSNFRAMVQEFTGIPAPLFTNNINTRLNSFFGLSPSLSPTYNLLRPFAQKLAPTPNLINQQISNSSCSASTDFYQNHLNLQSLLQDPIRSQVSDAAGINATNDHSNVRTSVSLVEEFGLGGIQNTGPPSNNTAAVTEAMLCRRERGNTENRGYNDGGDDNNIINPLRLMTDINNGERDESSGFQGENRGLVNVTATRRNEGTIESWLCSSSDQRS